MKTNTTRLMTGYATLLLCSLTAVGADNPTGASKTLTDKTLVVWASPATLDQSGGSALTMDNLGGGFDGIVFAEIKPKAWAPGSDSFNRAPKNKDTLPLEAAPPGQFIQLAITYQDKTVTIYRNGEKTCDYKVDRTCAFSDDLAIVFGVRHIKPDNKNTFIGAIDDARIYDRALTQAEIKTLVPNKPSAIKPVIWFDFEDGKLSDKTGRFTDLYVTGNTHVKDGKLILPSDGSSLVALPTGALSTRFAEIAPTLVGTKATQAMPIATVEKKAPPAPTITGHWSKSDPGEVPELVLQSARQLREKYLADSTRPGYHFACVDGYSWPGDPNGAFYAKGRYHLMYLRWQTWSHISSNDLIHWRHHPDAIANGAWSGGGFLDDDGTAYLTYWKLGGGSEGIGVAKSSDAKYELWQPFKEPAVKSTAFGITETKNSDGSMTVTGSADPSNIWKKDGKYYVLGGNCPVLDKYGRKPDSPAQFKGDHLYLYESANLESWKYKGEFYERNPAWTDVSEDDMCPSFLPLPSSPDGGKPSGKHLLLFIAHNRGCQYYVGNYDTKNDKFIPENHGRMTWKDTTTFAPEAMIDGKGRQIMWAWLHDNPRDEKERGWSGAMCLPRLLWLGADNTLRMKPVPELNMLRGDEQSWNDIKLDAGQTKALQNVIGDSCELEINITSATAKHYGVKVRTSSAGEEETLLFYDAEKKELVFDSTKSGKDGRMVVEAAPFVLAPNEPLQLRVFIDKSIIEIFANDRQVLSRRVYPSRKDALGIVLFAEGGQAIIKGVKAWEMMPSNPY